MIRQEWLQPLAAGPPCGPNLEYDQEFLALEEAATGPPGNSSTATTVIPAKEPDWADVVERASALLDRTRDLRIVLLLTRGLTRTEGLSGLRDGLALARGPPREASGSRFIPQLDFDGEPDPILRMNALATFADSEGLVRDARRRYSCARRSVRSPFATSKRSSTPRRARPNAGDAGAAARRRPRRDRRRWRRARRGGAKARGARRHPQRSS